jgi:hypothetical protein
MTQTRLPKTAGVLRAFAAIILAGMVNSSKRVGARVEDTSDQREESRIRRGHWCCPLESLNREHA